MSNVDDKSRFVAFFDECGDHSMEKIDKDFPLFVLALVVMVRGAYRDQALTEFNRFKLRYFNHEGINLHSRDIRLATGPFSLLLNPNVRPLFMTGLSDLMERLLFTLFISAIHKHQHQQQRGGDAENPYELALAFTLERLVRFLDAAGETHLPIVAEARGKREDNSLEKVCYRIMARGTEAVNAEQFKRLDCPLKLSIQEEQHRRRADCRPLRSPVRPAHLEPGATEPRVRGGEEAHLQRGRGEWMAGVPVKLKWAPPACARDRPPTEHSQSGESIGADGLLVKRDIAGQLGSIAD
ncbi:MAG: hypothetical protein HY674_05145 [Chloroflexi bacterium]|nr:hypothetical protein [Chloroflexota bacterium]